MNPQHEGYYVGLMTGTSMDAVDTTLVKILANNKTQLLASYGFPLSDNLRKRIIKASADAVNRHNNFTDLDTELAEIYARCVLAVLEKAGVNASEIIAIGSHGQTIRHCPECQPPYTIQLGNAERIVELTGITTVNDFRQADIAAGGQGAPLAPIFHHHLFSVAGKNRVCINLGGVANISILHADGSISGFDTGPANNLMDQWTERHLNKRYDRDAQWANTGKVCAPLLDALLSEPWLSKTPPKSTGPELFNLRWLDKHLQDLPLEPADVQRSLCEYSAVTVADAICRYAPDCEELIICGGGAYNPLLIERIGQHLPDARLSSSTDYSIAPEWIEACMFAWLAHRTLNGLPGNIPTVTGASHEVILGTIHAA